MDIEFMRRQLQIIHSALRDEGHNPLEAVSRLAAAVTPNGDDTNLRSSEYLKGALAGFASIADAGGMAVAFQQLMANEARNGLGQYLTPAPVAELIAAVVAAEGPRTVLDPFAGSGLLLERIGNLLPDAQLLGIEINPAVAQVARAVSKMSHHPIDVMEGDAFLLWAEHRVPVVDAVITNPPFGSTVSRVAVSSLVRAGASPSLTRLKSIPAELLGLDLSVAVLREGGLLAVVLPQSVIANSRWSEYRADLFRRLKLRAAISLPEETFGPFKGVAKACLLIGIKTESALPHSVPYFRSRSVGYDETGRISGKSDLSEIQQHLASTSTAEMKATIDELGRFIVPSENGRSLPQHSFRLGDQAEVFTGRTPPRGSHAQSGPQQLSVGGLSGSFIPWRPRARSYVTHETFVANKRAHLQVNDICLTAAAHKPRYIGLKVDLVDVLPPEGVMASAEVLVIRLTPEAPISAVQLLFYLRSEGGYEQIQQLVRGSTAHLYPADVKEILIPLDTKPETTKLAEQAFWEAARCFREYLHHEARAAALVRDTDAIPRVEEDGT